MKIHLLAFLFGLAGLRVQAQWVPVAPPINTPFGPATINTMRYQPMTHFYQNSQFSRKHHFTIILKNDSVF